MTQRNNIMTQPINWVLLGKRMLLGAAIGLILISVFVLAVRNPNPAWGKLWMIRPLIVVPLAGAMAGVCSHFLDYFSDQGGWKKIAANVVSFIVHFIALWMGSVLGLVGTLWN